MSAGAIDLLYVDFGEDLGSGGVPDSDLGGELAGEVVSSYSKTWRWQRSSWLGPVEPTGL